MGTRPTTARTGGRRTGASGASRLQRRRFSEGITNLGFDIYDSGSAFYLWARIPAEYSDALTFNEMLMRDAGVGMTPGSAFADTDLWDAHVRICIAREDQILDGALKSIEKVLTK